MERSIPFVELTYRSDDGKTELSLFIFHKLSGIEVSIQPDWRSRLTDSARSYLEGLMDDWRKTPPEETSLLMEEMVELSTGPLRCVGSGEVTTERMAWLRSAGAID